MARVTGAVEVRPTCPVCGSVNVKANGSDMRRRIVYRRCEDCGTSRKYRVLLAAEVRVYEGEIVTTKDTKDTK